MNDKPIGILDSGIGGLTVAKEVIGLLPSESIVYIGDSKNTPYGAKSSDEIYERSKELVRFLLDKEAKLIIVACNTITVQCIDQLRSTFPDVPIIGTVPVVKTAAAITESKRIGILSTSQTSASEYHKKLIDLYAADCKVYNYGTDSLVPLIEKGLTQGEELDAILQEVLNKFKKGRIDTLALGCTHYPLIAGLIQRHLGTSVHLLDSGAAIARRVAIILKNNQIGSGQTSPSYQFYTTGSSEVMQCTLKGLTIAAFPVTVNTIFQK